MKKACYGYYGMNNFGDDMFLYAINQKNDNSRTQLIAISPEVGKLENMSFMVKKRYEKTYRNKGIIGKIFRFYIVTKAYIVADEFSYVGGSTLSSDTSLSMLKYLKILKKFIPKKLTAEGVSIGPFKNEKDKKIIMEFISTFDRIVVRDLNSYNTGKKYGLKNIELGEDLVLSVNKTTNNLENSLIITLIKYESLNNLNNNDEFERNYTIRKAVEEVCRLNEDLKIKIVVLNTDLEKGDNNISKTFFKELQSTIKNQIEIIEYNNNLETILETFGSAKAILTTRLHGGIISQAFKKPYILVEYHKKCTDFLNDVNHPNDLRVERKVESAKNLKTMILKILN